MSSIQRDRKAENNQGNNQIVNITLGEKTTKEIRQEAIPVELPVDKDDDINDKLVQDLEKIIIKFDEIKDEIISMGIPIPKRLSKIPDDISEINTLEDIRTLIKEINSRIKELERIKLRPKSETPQQAVQPTFYHPPHMPTAFAPRNLFRQFVPHMPTGTAQMYHQAPPSRPGEERPVQPIIPPSKTGTGGPSQKCPTYDDVVDMERQEILAKLGNIKANMHHTLGERSGLLNNLIIRMTHSRARLRINARCDAMRIRWFAMEKILTDFRRELSVLLETEAKKPPPLKPEPTPPTPEPEQQPPVTIPVLHEGETPTWDPVSEEWIYPTPPARDPSTEWAEGPPRDEGELLDPKFESIITDYINKLNAWRNDIIDRTYGDEYYSALLQEKLNMLQTALSGTESEQQNAINDAELKVLFINSDYPAANALKYISDQSAPVKLRTFPSNVYDSVNDRIIYDNINELSLKKVQVVPPGSNQLAEVYRISINNRPPQPPNFGPQGALFNPDIDPTPTQELPPGTVSPDYDRMQMMDEGGIRLHPSSFGQRGRAEGMVGMGQLLGSAAFGAAREGVRQGEQQRTGERLPPAIGDLPGAGTTYNPYGQGLTQP